MTFYELLHFASPDVLLASIREIVLHDIVFCLESAYLPNVLSATPAEDDNIPISVLHDRYFKPIVAFGTMLGTEISLPKVLGRQVMVSDHLKHLPAEKIAAYCYCALPISLVTNPNGMCNISQAFDFNTNSVETKVFDKLRLY